MGRAFLVHDRLNPRRRTALTLIREDLSLRALALFRKAFLTLARLSHPHLQRARDFRRFERRCWFTYDFIPGRDLADWSRGKPISAILPLFLQAIGVLRFLHAHGVLHLHLKPPN